MLKIRLDCVRYKIKNQKVSVQEYTHQGTRKDFFFFITII